MVLQALDMMYKAEKCGPYHANGMWECILETIY